MNPMHFGSWGMELGAGALLLILWSLVWKGLGLWHAGRRGEPIWFIAILLINVFGILELIYLFLILKLKPGQLFRK